VADDDKPIAAPSNQGYVWRVLDVLFAKDGRRSYDSGRVKAVIALLALCEVIIRLGFHLIDKQFDAYSAAMTRVQTTEVEERRIATKTQVDALERVSGKIDVQTTAVQDLTMTIREAWLMRGGVQPRKKTP
jgi:hypothetical protein